jgi:hypothetical protein
MEEEMTEVATQFAADLAAIETALNAMPHNLAATPWRTDGWTRKQIVGHLCDSAANNRQRFVRASIDGKYAGPGYEQDAWVDAHGYAGMEWETLLGWWLVEHEILKAVVARIPADRLETSCRVGDNAPVTLRFLIEDYIAHQQHHLKQIQAPVPPR